MKLRSAILGTSSIVCGIAVICAAAFVTSAHPARAGINVWTSYGPGTAGIAALAVDPGGSGTLYAGTYAGVFKSSDGGSTWSATGEAGTVTALAFDSAPPGTLYAWADYTVFKRSTNGGTTWDPAETPPLTGSRSSLWTLPHPALSTP